MRSPASLPLPLNVEGSPPEFLTSEENRKQLGQCFTGQKTARLLTALLPQNRYSTVVDPMAGHGDLLEAAAERCAMRTHSGYKICGVEIDPSAASFGLARIEACKNRFQIGQSEYRCADAFEFQTWRNTSTFDLVVANPPYVRYQTLSKLLTSQSIQKAPEQIRQSLVTLARHLAPPEELATWQTLLSSYSGLADLSVPSWFLCSIMTSPGGVMALVVPQTWLNRDYAKIIRYTLLRFFEPLAIVEERGQRWFTDAQIPVTLVVARRLFSHEAIIRLRDRTNVFQCAMAEVAPDAASRLSHVGASFNGPDPEGAFATWLFDSNDSVLGIRRSKINTAALRDEALTANQRSSWLSRLEEPSTSNISVRSIFPPSAASDLDLSVFKNFIPLADSPIKVGQGLRTGCNDFFYVTDLGEISAGLRLVKSALGNECFAVPDHLLRPVVRRQVEINGLALEKSTIAGRVLDLRAVGLSDRDKCSDNLKPLYDFIERASRTPIKRANRLTTIPELSAVKPNGLGPNDSQLELCEGSPRMWYMLPNFAPRHFGTLMIPRIIHDAPTAILNTNPPVLVDANFSTIWSDDTSWSPALLFGIFNSTWGEFCMEAIGTPLGGGALKLEAAHLRGVPIPLPTARKMQGIVREVSHLLRQTESIEIFRKLRKKLDAIIFRCLIPDTLTDDQYERLIEGVRNKTSLLREKRRLR